MRFFSTTFNPTIIPVCISRAKYTLPNLPSPSFLITLKCYLHTPSFPANLNLGGDFDWHRKNEGNVRYDLFLPNPSVEFDVEDVSFRGLFAFPPELRAGK